jgi:hypothetical protein
MMPARWASAYQRQASCGCNTTYNWQQREALQTAILVAGESMAKPRMLHAACCFAMMYCFGAGETGICSPQEDSCAAA